MFWLLCVPQGWLTVCRECFSNTAAQLEHKLHTRVFEMTVFLYSSGSFRRCQVHEGVPWKIVSIVWPLRSVYSHLAILLCKLLQHEVSIKATCAAEVASRVTL